MEVTDKADKYLRAMKDVNDGLSTRKAANKQGLERTTLQIRINGRAAYNKRKGPSPILTKLEETQIADWLIKMSNHGVWCAKE